MEPRIIRSEVSENKRQGRRFLSESTMFLFSWQKLPGGRHLFCRLRAFASPQEGSGDKRKSPLTLLERSPLSSNPSFADLIVRLRAGDADAAEQVFRRFAQRLVALARKQLDTLIRQKVDPEDVVQAVFRSFFRKLTEGTWKLDGWHSVGRLLTTITLNKCGHQIAYFQAARRDVRREVPLALGVQSPAAWEALARDPTPDEAAVLADTVADLLRDLTPRDQIVLGRTIHGASVAVIAAELRCSERTVQRVLRRVRQRLRRLSDDRRTEA